jgi:tetratricopeptide (TPR) repeat protein
MDCHKVRVAALAVVVSCWGCGKSSVLPVAGSPASVGMKEPIVADARKDAEEPLRQPKPSTCVALAVMREQTALTKQSPAERTELYDQARRAYQHAIKLDPQYAPAYKGLARLYETIQDHERAVETFHRAAQVSPKDHEVYYLMGMYHARQKQWQQALEALYRAVELDPENRRYLNDFGLCLARAGRYQDAFNVLRKTGGDAHAHYTLARMLEHLGMQEPSREHLRLALEHKPDMQQARQMLHRLDNPNAGGVMPVGHEEPK